MGNQLYDVLIVGAGIAGSALAHALSTIPRSQPLRIALLERSLAEPDRIVGELLQPGGVNALKKLGLVDCLEGIDAIPVHGYCVVKDGQSVHIPYPGAHEGRSFHHGRFVMKLRGAAQRAQGVDVIEATASELIEDARGRVVGVKATVKRDIGGEEEVEKKQFYAKLVFIADGCFSNFRTNVLGEAGGKHTVKSHFVGVVLEDVTLPIPQHGTVALVKGHGPVLLYQISEHSTRMLVDVRQPFPADLPSHILTNIMPQLPSSLHLPIEKALTADRLRRMPNSFLPATDQGNTLSKTGVILVGDAWNMRHPLTGGGMTVALHDVVLLRGMLSQIPDFDDWSQIQPMLSRWHWDRKPLASTVNILSVALYDLFGANDPQLAILRAGCFKYFELGGECVNGPVSLLSGIAESPTLLARHFFAVAFYSIWVMFTHPQIVKHSSVGKPLYAVPRLHQYPELAIQSVRVFCTAVVVFAPLLWTEVHGFVGRRFILMILSVFLLFLIALIKLS